MTDEQLIEAQMVLGKEALRLSLEILNEGNTSTKLVSPYALFEGDTPGDWKMTIEKVR